MTQETDVELRPEVAKLAEEMEIRLRAHDRSYGERWKQLGLAFLNMKMIEARVELYELTHDVANFGRAPVPAHIWHEAADLANYAMMVAARYEILWRAAHQEDPAGDDPTT